MRKLQEWMHLGATVLANGKKGKITLMQTNEINDVKYVYYITVKLEGQNHGGTYHPNDITEFKEN